MKKITRRLRWTLRELTEGGGDFCADTCLVSDELRIVYAFIPKAGCTSIKTWLLRHGGFSPEIAREFADAEANGGKPPDAHNHMRSRFSLRHRSRTEIADVLRDPSYFKFCVVRHPLSRLVSAYLSKVVRNNAVAHELIISGQISAGCLKPKTFLNWLRGRPLDPARGLTFREFVHALEKQNPKWLDSHFRAQDRLLKGIEFNAIVKLENIQYDFEVVRQYLGVEVPLALHNTSSYKDEGDGCVADAPAASFRRGKAPHWTCFYDDMLQAECERLYALDFKRFNYEMTSRLNHQQE